MEINPFMATSGSLCGHISLSGIIDHVDSKPERRIRTHTRSFLLTMLVCQVVSDGKLTTREISGIKQLFDFNDSNQALGNLLIKIKNAANPMLSGNGIPLLFHYCFIGDVVCGQRTLSLTISDIIAYIININARIGHEQLCSDNEKLLERIIGLNNRAGNPLPKDDATGLTMKLMGLADASDLAGHDFIKTELDASVIDDIVDMVDSCCDDSCAGGLIAQKTLGIVMKEELHDQYYKSVGDSSGEFVRKENIEDVLVLVNQLIGMTPVKTQIKSLINYVGVNQKRVMAGVGPSSLSLHMVFSGNPGTGKTTVARLVGRAMCAMGVLKKGHVIEVDRSGLVAGYMGQTALKTSEVCKAAIDGILFIDEAYSLAKDSGNDYGKEAIDTLLKFMEDNRDRIAVIVAGYKNEMGEFLQSNPGLMSRFNRFVDFPDYSANELFDILCAIAKERSYIFDDGGLQAARNTIIGFNPTGTGFANARSIRNYLENIFGNHSDRLSLLSTPSKEELTTLIECDVMGVDLR
jgi:hypothetical protein